MVLRVGILGVAHWHLDNYVPPLAAMPDVRIVGVSDPDGSVARRVAEDLGCAWSADFREVARRTDVDFVFALGRHCDMAAQGQHLIEEGIPFAMEKPCGIDAAEVQALRAAADARAAFAAVPFVWRYSDFMEVLRDLAPDDRHEYLSLRIVSGHPSRYPESGNAWMLDPKLAGGGSTLNLAVHLIDLFRVLSGVDEVQVEAASMGYTAFGLGIEDWSALVLRAGDAYCVAESGFLYPAPTGTYDVRFTIKTDQHYILSSFDSTDVLDLSGGRTSVATRAANQPTYAAFVTDVLERFRAGRPPPADLRDMDAVMAVVSRGYELARTAS